MAVNTITQLGSNTFHGTIGVLAWNVGTTGTTASIIIESLDINPTHNGPMQRITNGDGAKVGLILLEDGFEFTAQALFDKVIAPPALAAKVTLSWTQNNAATSYANTYITATPYPKFKRGDSAMMEIRGEYSPGIA